jgi:drug/metabolite transporter (DMT)-like permease
VIVGVIAGFLGVVLLVGKGSIGAGVQLPALGIAACLGGAFSWAAGSVFGQRASLPSKPILISGMQMLCGGLLMTVTGVAVGEGRDLHFNAIKAVSIGGWLYLIIFGAIIGFTAYAWLVRVTTPARVSTHAYVNPVVAVMLGWSVASEPITVRMIVAMAIILTAVVLITAQPGKRKKSREIILNISDNIPGDGSDSADLRGRQDSKSFATSNGIKAAD